jgi:hypothetical protein
VLTTVGASSRSEFMRKPTCACYCCIAAWSCRSVWVWALSVVSSQGKVLYCRSVVQECVGVGTQRGLLSRQSTGVCGCGHSAWSPLKAKYRSVWVWALSVVSSQGKVLTHSWALLCCQCMQGCAGPTALAFAMKGGRGTTAHDSIFCLPPLTRHSTGLTSTDRAGEGPC